MQQVPYVSFGQRRTHELDPTLKAEVFDVMTEEGHSLVGVHFDEQLATGGVREFRTGLARLEFIAKRAEAYAESRSTEEQVELVGHVEARFRRGKTPDRGGAVDVQLSQAARDGSGEWQTLTLSAENLKTAVHEGQKLEQELGYTQRWHVLVDALSLTRDEAGPVHATVRRSFESEDAARMFLGKNEGFALYGEPQRRAFSHGDSIELWAGADMLVEGQHHARSVEQQLGWAEWSQERISERFIVARWNDVGRAPGVGQRATWEGTGQEHNGEPEDFRAGPTTGRVQGEPVEPVWVLIERDTPQPGQVPKPGQGIIRGFSGERKDMTAELERQEGIEQALARDLSQQSFGMDRNQYTQGHSM